MPATARMTLWTEEQKNSCACVSGLGDRALSAAGAGAWREKDAPACGCHRRSWPMSCHLTAQGIPFLLLQDVHVCETLCVRGAGGAEWGVEEEKKTAFS